jgi:hypothetical protein
MAVRSFLPAALCAWILGGTAMAADLNPIQDYVDARGYGQMDHSYPLVRCGALYMTSLKVAGEGLEPEKAVMVQETAMKMAAIASKFRMRDGDDPTQVANGVMDDLEGLIGDYEARATGRRGFSGDSLVKKDFKYCRTVSEPFVRAYDMDPPSSMR